jgi:hypothetical protein
MLVAVAMLVVASPAPAAGAGHPAARTPARATAKKAAATAAKASAKRPEAAKKPEEKPRPDPLAGAWRPKGASPQLGNGTLPSEVLVSTLRVLGLSGSFDADSFIRHVLYVNDIARKDAFAEDGWARSLARRLGSLGLIRRERTPHRGDLVFFSLSPREPGRVGEKILAGVVDGVGKTRATFIAPVGDRVVRGILSLEKPPAGKAPTDTPLLRCEPPPAPKAEPKPAKGKVARKDAKPVARKATAKAPPCRASELLIGTTDVEAVPRAFRVARASAR